MSSNLNSTAEVSVKGIVLTFLELHVFAFLPRVTWEDRYHFHALNKKLDAAAGSLNLA